MSRGGALILAVGGGKINASVCVYSLDEGAGEARRARTYSAVARARKIRACLRRSRYKLRKVHDRSFSSILVRRAAKPGDLTQGAGIIH